MSKSTCPVCGIDEDEDCGCNPLKCPQCGQVVIWFGEEYGMNPCRHVVVWGTAGEEPVWEDKKHEQQFHKHWSKHLENTDEDRNYEICDLEEDAIKSYVEEQGLEFECHDDGIGHGHSTGTYVVFRKKSRPVNKASHPTARLAP